MSRIVEERIIFIPLCKDCDENYGLNCMYSGKISLLWGDRSGRSCDTERLPVWPFDVLFSACVRPAG